MENIIRIVPDDQTYAETARNIWKIGIVEDSLIGRLNKRYFNEKINSKVYFNVFWGANVAPLYPTYSS